MRCGFPGKGAARIRKTLLRTYPPSLDAHYEGGFGAEKLLPKEQPNW
jgi:hypothetical protein